MESCSAVVIVYNPSTKQVLFLDRNDEISGWCIPGGKVDLIQESVVKGAVRELFEETGIFIDCKDPHDQLKYLGKCLSINKRNVYVYFLEINNPPLIKLSEEHKAYCWTRDFSSLNLAGNTIDFLKLKFKNEIPI
jgi:8-oxo-dGTP pyrophosphatase MutT (NUDIX family)